MRICLNSLQHPETLFFKTIILYEFVSKLYFLCEFVTIFTTLLFKEKYFLSPKYCPLYIIRTNPSKEMQKHVETQSMVSPTWLTIWELKHSL